MISAIIITFNEEHNLRACLQSIDFCDEIVVVDSGSTDDTLNIAKEFGCVIMVTHDWPGFGAQKQRALELATGAWVLSVDADEMVTPHLRTEIIDAISKSENAGYFIDRESYFLGKRMRYGGWSPDYVLRLGRRNLAQFTSSPVHEQMTVQGKTAKLKEPMIHFSYRTIEQVLTKQIKYALAAAGNAKPSNSISTIFSACIHSLWTFVRLYFLKLGLLDGRHGFIAAASKAQETFWKYAVRCFIS